MKDVKLIRFITGELIIAEVLSQADDVITVNNPIRVVTVKDKNNQETVVFLPWMLYTETQKFRLDRSGITFIENPIGEFVTNYQQMFSGIITPKQNLILPS